jgi:hypothetical protein
VMPQTPLLCGPVSSAKESSEVDTRDEVKFNSRLALLHLLSVGHVSIPHFYPTLEVTTAIVRNSK